LLSFGDDSFGKQIGRKEVSVSVRPRTSDLSRSSDSLPSRIPYSSHPFNRPNHAGYEHSYARSCKTHYNPPKQVYIDLLTDRPIRINIPMVDHGILTFPSPISPANEFPLKTSDLF